MKIKRWQHDEQENSVESGSGSLLDEPSSRRRTLCQRDEVASDDARRFLQCHGLLEMHEQQRPFWLCTAELNVLLRCFQHTFSHLHLLHERCFARNAKPAALQQVAWAHGCRSEAELQQHPHLAALLLALQVACPDCSEVSITALTFVAPPWLEGWCRKWVDGQRSVTLLVVQAYRSVPAPLRASAVFNIGHDIMTTAAPHRTLYIPILCQ